MLALFSTVVFAFAVLQAAPPQTAQSGHAGNAREMTLVLPHALRKGETAWLLVKIGAIDHYQIRITTQDGRPLGTLSPYGVRSGQGGGTYTVPVPAEDFRGRRLALRLSVMLSGHAQRAPTTEEVKSVRILIRRFRTQPPSGANP